MSDDQAQKPGGAIWISADGNARQDGKLLNGPLIVPDAESRHAKVQKHVADILPDAPAREWWIKEASEHTDETVIDKPLADMMWPKDPLWKDDMIHVIEKSAYDAAIAQTTKMREACADYPKMVDKLLEERDALKLRVAELSGYEIGWKNQINYIETLKKEVATAKAEIESLQFNLKQKEGEIGRAEHRGNTVDYIYDKLENYSRQLREVGPALTQANQRIKELEADRAKQQRNFIEQNQEMQKLVAALENENNHWHVPGDETSRNACWMCRALKAHKGGA